MDTFMVVVRIELVDQGLQRGYRLNRRACVEPLLQRLVESTTSQSFHALGPEPPRRLVRGIPPFA